MSKKIDWNTTYKVPFSKKANGSKYETGKEMLKSAFEKHQEQEKLQKSTQEMIPAMEQLFLIRLKNNTPITIMREFRYQTSDIVKSNIGGEAVGSFQDVVKSIYPGTTLQFISIDHPMKEVLFKANNEEIAINFADLKNLWISSDILEVVSNLYKDNK